MELDTIEYVKPEIDLPAPPPPPPPPPPAEDMPANLKIRNTNGGPPPLVVLDGVITDVDVNGIKSETIESVSVLKDQYAIDKYGEKGKNGVIEITSKKDGSLSEPKEPAEVAEASPVNEVKSAEGVFVAVEELPAFPGMESWLHDNLKYPAEAYTKKITGIVNVAFLVTSAGKIRDVQVIKPVNPLLDAEAKRVISSMPDWKPGTQHGKTVPVQMKVPVEFKLK